MRVVLPLWIFLALALFALIRTKIYGDDGGSWFIAFTLISLFVIAPWFVQVYGTYAIKKQEKKDKEERIREQVEAMRRFEAEKQARASERERERERERETNPKP